MKNKQSKFWTYVSLIVTSILIVLEIVSSKLINDSSIPTSIDGPFAGFVSLMAIVVFVISIVALLKIKRWAKVVPIIGLFVALIIFGLAFFAYAFSDYGSLR